MSSITKKRVAVLRGGSNHHYDTSLKTGAFVLKNIPEEFEVFDCLIDKEGVWYFKGLPKKPEKIFSQVDVIFNALHGSYGEDGQIQNLLKIYNIPHTGSDVLTSNFAINKHFSKKIWTGLGIKMPHSIVLNKNEVNQKKIYDIWTNFPQPSIVKPASSGLSFGVSVVLSLKDLEEALFNAFNFSSSVLIEEFIKGREVNVSLISGFRGQKLYSLPAVEVKKKNNNLIFHHDHKYNGDAYFDHQSLTSLEKLETQKVAELAYKSLGLSNYGIVDMIVHPKRGVFLLEINTQPPLYENSPFINAFHTVGIEPRYFLDHILKKSIDVLE